MQAGEENEEAQGPIKIDLGAAAKVSAVAKYERKTEVSIDVPEDVTRAKAEALLDAISPFTESLGLVGDWIADTRQRLRVQRIEALSVIATKARKAIEQQNDRPKQIPIKALLPILDRASLEEPGDESLTTAWGALIASASLDYDPEVMAFSRILSELSPRECLVLERIFGNRHEWALGDRASGAMRKFFDSEGTIKPLILDAVLKGDTAIFEKLRARHHLVHLRGALREAFVTAGRGAAPAGSCTQHGHSGGIGAPPGTTRSPCQELADRLGKPGIRKARPDAVWTLRLARREAPAALP
jgi:hypothetical protein